MSTKDQSSHTPGSWKIARSGYSNAPSVIFVGEKMPDFGARYPLQGVDWIAEVREDESPRSREYTNNTRLIAAAPDLLEAAWQAIEALNTGSDSDYVSMRIKAKHILAAAINRAEGRKP